MQKYRVTPQEALQQIRQSRPLCEPNEGFMSQLELYHEMQMPESLGGNTAYQKWLYQREVEMSRACGQAPEAEKIRFEDEHVGAKEAGGFDLKCRKCRLESINGHSSYAGKLITPTDEHWLLHNSCFLTRLAIQIDSWSLLTQWRHGVAQTAPITSSILYHGCDLNWSRES